MNRLQLKLMSGAMALCLLFALSAAPAFAKLQAGSPDDQATSTSRKKKKKNTKDSASTDNQPAATSDAASAPPSSAPAAVSSASSSTPVNKASFKASAGSVPPDAEIAAAKASGKVWVNLDTGIYHKAGRWYGKTKNGKFMTADEAKKVGYRPAKRD